MKKVKKYLAVILTLIMIISIIPLSSITASAAASGTCGDSLTWAFDEETGTLTISGTGEMQEIYHYSGSRPWDDYHNSIKKVVIEEGVKTISDYAFYYYNKITSITLPDSMTTIGAYAFSWCTSLTDVTIPNGVTKIGNEAFSFCQGITKVTIGKSVKEINDVAFIFCNNLESFEVVSNNQYYSNDEYGVLFNKDKTTLIQYPLGNTGTSYTIPDGVIKIGYRAFFGASLTSVTIPDSVVTISEMAFLGTGLTSILIPDSVITIEKSAFDTCSNLENVTIGKNVATIGTLAFSSCSKLKYVNIPASVVKIDDKAFSWCEALTGIDVDSDNQYYSSDEYGVLFNKDKTTLIQYPMGNISNSYTIPDSVLIIGNGAFHNSINLETITIGENVTTICKLAFGSCNSLTSITIPESVRTIDCNAFFLCTNLTSVTISVGVETIGERAFYGCESLTDVYYSGTQAQWNRITIEDNECLLNADLHLNNCEHTDYDDNGYCDECNEFLDSMDECDCNCHKSGISKFFFKIILFFQKLFGLNRECACGVVHY